MSEEFTKRFSKVREEKGVRLYSVVVGSHSANVKEVSDTKESLLDLRAQGDNVAENPFEAVWSLFLGSVV